MDVTFTNVLEGARQYFQGLPINASSAPSPAYQNPSEPQQRNNETKRGQEHQQSPKPYWMGQPEQHCLPSRETTPNQRPPSYSSDSSRPPSHPLYINTSQEQRTSSYSSNFQEQSSQYQMHMMSQQQQQQLQQFSHQQQSHLQPHSPRTKPPKQQFSHHGQPAHYQQQGSQHPSTAADFQFTRPHHRDAPTNTPNYPAHILQNPAYHHQAATSHSSSLTTSPKASRKLETSKSVPHSSNYTPPTTSSTQTSTGYVNYQHNRSFYPANSYASHQPTTDNKNYSTPQGYPYQQSSQMCNPNYYNSVYQPQTSSTSMYSSTCTSTHSSRTEQQNVTYSNQSSRTHNLPPIAQFSESYFKSVRENQKLSSGRGQTNAPSAASSMKNQNSQGPLPVNQNYKADYQYNVQRAPNQLYTTSSSAVTTTSSSFNSVISRSSGTFSVQSLTSGNNQLTPKSSQNVSNPSFGNTTNRLMNTDQRKNSTGNKQKRESPLDLSVKTVRTPADSTLDDLENERTSYLASGRVPPISAHFPTFDAYTNSYQRMANVQRVPQTNAANKLDYIPTYGTLGNAQQNYQSDQRSGPNFQQIPKSQKSQNDGRINAAHKNDKERSSERFPAASVPNTAHPYPQFENPTLGNGLKTSAVYPAHILDNHRKRPADTAPSINSKVPKTESWRQTIDRQIEQKLSTYKQGKEEQKSKESYINTSKESLTQNGNYSRPKEAYSNNYSSSQYHSGLPSQQPFNINPYNTYPNHSQTYVPSPANTYNASSPHQSLFPSRDLIRSNSNSSLSSVKSNSGGAADKRVLTLLRNSIETKGVKEAQRKYGQEQLGKYVGQPHHRSDIQQPTTHVTAPLQPRPAFMGRQNVSPFTPNSLPEGNNTTPLFNKLHVPRAIDSINFDINKTIANVANKQLEAVINDQNNPNGDLDGLAAFLAARIRTKAELKQVSPNQQVNNNSNSVVQNIENQIRTALKQENLPSSNSSGSSSGTNVPKVKEYQLSQQPRKRLFSRSEDDNGNATTKTLPGRDKSGLRSSSETSVFDFPDSGSDGEMPVLEMSLTAMRKDRKLSLKQTSTNEIKDVKPEVTQRPLSPEDDIFLQACDTFMDQLKAGIGKKRGRRKKPLEPEVLAKLESVAKENPIEEEIKIKEENQDEPVLSSIETKNKNAEVSVLDKTDQNDEEESVMVSNKIIEELSLSLIKTEAPDDFEEPQKETSKVIQKAQLYELSDSDGETIKQLSNKLKNKSNRETEKTNQPNELQVLVSKPTKKPPFGDGSAFYPGWEEEVYKYKKSLRMPPSLIQVRPPSSMRHSTSLPDLDPCHSPSSSTLPEKDEDTKNIYSKVKTEPFDSDLEESNSSFNLFNSKSNYDSEGGSSIRSLPTPVKDSIVDKLLQKCGKKKKRKYKKKEDAVGPKIIPKAENPIELLPTPSLEIEIGDKKESVIKTEAPILGFRKSTIENFKDAFLSRANNIVGVNEQFSTVILKSRTRKETRVLKQRATIKEVFGEDRPASAPPLSCINVDLKDIKKEVEDDVTPKEEPTKKVKENSTQSLKNKLMGRSKVKNNLFKSITDKKLRTGVLEELSADKEVKIESRDQSPSILSEELDSKSETVSLDGEENAISVKKRGKMNKIRRKCSSGFDYIRKKKKQVKKDSDQNDTTPKKKKREPVLKASPESEQDIQKEIKSWVLNKGVGETHLHRSARLGYTDVTAYCLEKMECSPSPRDNAGYTPLHEACSRGHLDIARLLLMYGANVSESAKGGIRPLHEAVENGFIEIIRLLLSYGADPKLATYAGLTPLSLASDDTTRMLLINHMDDLEGKSEIPWPFSGPASCFDFKESGCDIFSSPPHPEPLSEEEDIEFEESEFLLPNLYTLQGETQSDRWILLQDLSNILKIKSRDALLKQICPTPPPGAPQNYKSVLRELKTSDFMEKAHCCQFLNASEKINMRASKIALVKYTDKIKELLKIENVVINGR